MKNWEAEYKVDFHIFTLTDGKKEIEYNSKQCFKYAEKFKQFII